MHKGFLRVRRAAARRGGRGRLGALPQGVRAGKEVVVEIVRGCCHPIHSRSPKSKFAEDLISQSHLAKQTDDGECADVNECDTGAHNCLESQRSVLILNDRREGVV